MAVVVGYLIFRNKDSGQRLKKKIVETTAKKKKHASRRTFDISETRDGGTRKNFHNVDINRVPLDIPQWNSEDDQSPSHSKQNAKSTPRWGKGTTVGGVNKRLHCFPPQERKSDRSLARG